MSRNDYWTTFLTGAIAIGGLISAIIFGYQLREMKLATDLSRESINLSREAIQISRQTLIASQRPWVSIEASVAGPFILNQGAAQISIGVRLKNHGHSPALNARGFVILDPDAAGQKGPEFCEYQRTRTATNFAQVIFPDDTTSEIQTGHADQQELAHVTERHNAFTPLITACVDYVSPFDAIRHQTRITANLVRAPTTPNGSFAIQKDEGNVSQANLHLEVVFGGFTAD